MRKSEREGARTGEKSARTPVPARARERERKIERLTILVPCLRHQLRSEYPAPMEQRREKEGVGGGRVRARWRESSSLMGTCAKGHRTEIYTHTCTHTHSLSYTHTHTHTHAHANTNTQTHAHKHKRTHTHTNTNTHTCTCT